MEGVEIVAKAYEWLWTQRRLAFICMRWSGQQHISDSGFSKDWLFMHGGVISIQGEWVWAS